MVVIEHHAAAIPEAGGQIIAQIAKSKSSRTEPFLKIALGV